MNQVDIFIIWISLILWVVFSILWTSKAYKAYLGILLGLLFCLLINLKLNYIISTETNANVIDYFLSRNRWFFSWISILALPILWLLVLINNSLSFKSIPSSLWELLCAFVMWLLLAPFTLWLYFIINNLWLNSSKFLETIIDFLKWSSLWLTLPNYEYIIFLLLFWILLYKFIFSYLFFLLLFFFNKIWELRVEERENRRRYKRVDNEDEIEEEENNENIQHSNEH